MFNKLKLLTSLYVFLLGLFVTVLYSYQLNFPTVAYYDEVHYTRFFHILIDDQKYEYLTAHPLLWGLLTWPFLAIFGESLSVWRIVSLIAGLLAIGVVYSLAKEIFKDKLTALFSVFFFTFDCISLTQARIAMMESLTLLFMLLSLYIFIKYWLNQKKPQRSALLGTGICLGLALSTKLTALSMALMIYPLFIWNIIKNEKNKSDFRNHKKKIRNRNENGTKLFFDGFVLLFVLPLIIYFSIYSWILFLPGYGWQDFWHIQQFNLHYHLVVAGTQTHGYASSWWGWPLLLRPIWFYFTSQQGLVNGIICIGNPIIFWAIPLMATYLCWHLVRHGRLTGVGIVIFGFLTQWLFYALGSRIKFFHYFYFAMPFVAMCLAWICAQLWKAGKIGKTLVSLYMILVLGMFIYWYPLLTGLSISDKYYQNHMWFRSWI